MSIQRYDIYGTASKHDSGKWVRFEDIKPYIGGCGVPMHGGVNSGASQFCLTCELLAKVAALTAVHGDYCPYKERMEAAEADVLALTVEVAELKRKVEALSAPVTHSMLRKISDRRKELQDDDGPSWFTAERIAWNEFIAARANKVAERERQAQQ